MSTTTTTTEPNQYQLALEAGGADLEIIGPRADGAFTITSQALDQAALDALVTAHVPDPAVVPPTPDLSHDPQTLINETPPSDLLMAIRAGAELANKAGPLWEALVGISLQNTARPAIEIVTDIALRAALDMPSEETP